MLRCSVNIPLNTILSNPLITPLTALLNLFNNVSMARSPLFLFVWILRFKGFVVPFQFVTLLWVFWVVGVAHFSGNKPK